MGTLRKYERSQSGCNVFFETGAGTGASLEHAISNGGFDHYYSVEIHDETARKAKAYFEGKKNVTILNCDSASASGLKEVLPKLSKSDKVFFFLDAHFSGEVSDKFCGYDEVEINKVNLPLENELELIRKMRPPSQDIVVVDDLRIYEDGEYENGNLPVGMLNLPEAIRNIDFVYRIFAGHAIFRLFFDEGYLLIMSKGSTFSLKKLSKLYRFQRRVRRFFKLKGQ